MKVISIIALLTLIGCASGHERGDTYRVMFGERCTKDGSISSRLWFHTTTGPDQVRKEWCKK